MAACSIKRSVLTKHNLSPCPCCPYHSGYLFKGTLISFYLWIYFLWKLKFVYLFRILYGEVLNSLNTDNNKWRLNLLHLNQQSEYILGCIRYRETPSGLGITFIKTTGLRPFKKRRVSVLSNVYCGKIIILKSSSLKYTFLSF